MVHRLGACCRLLPRQPVNGHTRIPPVYFDRENAPMFVMGPIPPGMGGMPTFSPPSTTPSATKAPPTSLLQKKINYDSLAVLPLGPICGICGGYALLWSWSRLVAVKSRRRPVRSSPVCMFCARGATRRRF